MIYVFDIDGTLCTEDHDDLLQRKPYKDRIDFVNLMHSYGNSIIIFTSRGMRSTNGDQQASDKKYRSLTEKQLADWGVKYDKLYFGKPYGDAYIDNHNTLLEAFFQSLGNTWPD